MKNPQDTELINTIKALMAKAKNNFEIGTGIFITVAGALMLVPTMATISNTPVNSILFFGLAGGCVVLSGVGFVASKIINRKINKFDADLAKLDKSAAHSTPIAVINAQDHQHHFKGNTMAQTHQETKQQGLTQAQILSAAAKRVKTR